MSESKCVVNADGTKQWLQSGKLHRIDGPAVEYSDGRKYWYLNGRYHREDGPAIENANGKKYWYLNGKELTQEEHFNLVSEEAQIDILFKLD